MCPGWHHQLPLGLGTHRRRLLAYPARKKALLAFEMWPGTLLHGSGH